MMNQNDRRPAGQPEQEDQLGRVQTAPSKPHGDALRDGSGSRHGDPPDEPRTRGSDREAP